MSTFKIDLGAMVRDKVTGFAGIVQARTEWLYGCKRYTVQPQKLDKDGKIQESMSFDEDALLVLRGGKRDHVASTGGPTPEPKRPSSVKRF